MMGGLGTHPWWSVFDAGLLITAGMPGWVVVVEWRGDNYVCTEYELRNICMVGGCGGGVDANVEEMNE